MKRNPELTAKMDDPIRKKVGLPLGVNAEFFVGNTNDFGQEEIKDIVDYNSPPVRQPGLWCQWTPNEDGTAIEWDQGEKFYSYVKWLQYIIDNFLQPWGYKLNGRVHWQGEESGDRGTIQVKNNKIETAHDVITNPLD